MGKTPHSRHQLPRLSYWHYGMTCERPDMKDNIWLIEVEVAASLLAATIIAFTLMLGHTL